MPLNGDLSAGIRSRLSGLEGKTAPGGGGFEVSGRFACGQGQSPALITKVTSEVLTVGKTKTVWLILGSGS